MKLPGGARLRLSTSLQRNILEAGVGGILNRFTAKNRRLTLFFEDIIGEYILYCEGLNHKDDLRTLAGLWGELSIQKLTPTPLKGIPPPMFLNTIGKKSWSNLGIIDDIHLDEVGDVIHLTTRNESITRLIGRNDFMLGFFKGTINGLYNSQSRIISCLQTKESCRYQFRLEHKPITVEGKDKSLYNRLNYLKPVNGFTLNDAVKKNILQLKEGNGIYFRGKRLTITENTIFHLVGNANLLLDKVPGISHGFFDEIINKDSTDEQKLILLKNLLQIMGWGIIKIIVKDRGDIIIKIRNPPHGLQSGKPNWDFLYNTLLGYIRLLDTDFVIGAVKEDNKNLRVLYLCR